MINHSIAGLPVKGKTLPCVDALKLVFAILIMCLHGNLLKNSTWGVWVEGLLARLAVPFFFVASGFFLGRKVYSDRTTADSAIKVYATRLAVKLLIFEPISVILQTIKLVATDTPAHITFLKIIRSILFYPAGALWYIQAVIVAALLAWPLIKRNREWLGFAIGVALYAFALLANRYYFLIEDTQFAGFVNIYMSCFVSARNGVFVGLMYLCTGLIIAKNWDNIANYKKQFRWVTLLCWLLLIVEFAFVKDKHGIDDKALYVTHVLLIPALFISAGQIESIGIRDTKTMRNLSTSIYLLHSPVLEVLGNGYKVLLGNELMPWILVAVSGLLILAFCYIVYKNKIEPVYDWIR